MRLKDLVDKVEVDPRKLTNYALCPTHDKGKDKAHMFNTYLGYTVDNYQLLVNQIQVQALGAEAILKEKDVHGDRYQVDLEIQGSQPHQRATVRTAWIVPPNADCAKLITLYVER